MPEKKLTVRAPRNMRYSGKIIWSEDRIRAEIARLDRKTGGNGASLPITFSNAKHTLGQFGIIDPKGAALMYFRFSHHWFQKPDWPEELALDTIRHEYAHYLNWIRFHGKGHDGTWKQCCRMVGARTERLYRSPEKGQPAPGAADEAARRAKEAAERIARDEAARKAREVAECKAREEAAHRMQGETALKHREDESFRRLREAIERMRRENEAARRIKEDTALVERLCRQDRYRVGRIVHHPTFGFARICAVTGSGSSASVSLDFDRIGKRSLPLSWVADNCRIIT